MTGEQRLACAVLARALQDLDDLGSGSAEKRADAEDAYRFLTTDNDRLRHWCQVAGYDVDVVRRAVEVAA